MSDRIIKKIGILGGTFDPIHNAHLALAECAHIQLSLDEIWFMPDANPPHKTERKVTAAEDRCRMTGLAIEGKPAFVLSLIEQKRAGYTYTADTLKLLKTQYPDCEFYFMIGSDSLYQIETWYHPERIMKLAVLAVAGRDFPGEERTLHEQADYLRSKYGARIEMLSFDEIDISSTEIRKMVSEGRDIRKLVPEKVCDYILAHRLYQEAL